MISSNLKKFVNGKAEVFAAALPQINATNQTKSCFSVSQPDSRMVVIMGKE